MPPQTFSVHIPIYGQDILVSIDYKAKDFIKHWKNKVFDTHKEYLLQAEEKIDDFFTGGSNAYFLFHDKSNLAVLLFKRSKDKIDFQSAVLHEVCHLVFWLLDKRGLPLRLETDEAYTYLIAFVYKEIMKKIK